MLLLALLATVATGMPVLQPQVLGCGVAGVDFVAQVPIMFLLQHLACAAAHGFMLYTT
jgi:hypothetical protein